MSERTQGEREKCLAAMSKPAPLDALELIASGRVLIEFGRDRGDVFIESLDGSPIRDPEFPDRKPILSGAWPLYRAGMIDEFGLVTEAGRCLLAVRTENKEPRP